MNPFYDTNVQYGFYENDKPWISPIIMGHCNEVEGLENFSGCNYQ